MALLSGTLANQPANMDASFGGAGFGVLYFATDTGQIFQWNGAAWVDVTSGIIGGRISSGVPVVTNGVQDGIVLPGIPANALKVGTVIDIDGEMSFTVQGASTSQIFFGASSLGLTSNDANASLFSFSVKLIVTGAAAQSIGGMGVFYEQQGITVLAPIPVVFGGTAAEAINAPIVVKTRQASGGATMSWNWLSVRWR